LCRTNQERFVVSIQPAVVLRVAFFMLIIQQYNPNLTSLFTTIQNLSQAPKMRILQGDAHLFLLRMRRLKEGPSRREGHQEVEEAADDIAAQNVERVRPSVMVILKKTLTTVRHVPGGSSLTPTVTETRREMGVLLMKST
jgi:UDP-N-acetylmuramyl pentapeptide synthase